MVLFKAPILSTEFKKQLSQIEEDELLSWEALMKDRHLLCAQQEQSQSMERRILDTSQKVTTLTERMEKLEEQVTQSNKSLQWIVDSLKSQGFSAKETQPQASTVPGESSNSLRKPEKEDGFHKKSRQFQCPDSFPVPEEKVSFSSFMPAYYSSEDGNGHARGPGPEGLDNYRNPGGRTGIRGRGALSRLGPNLNLDLVVTRWQDSTRSVLEFLAVLNQNLRSLALPGGPVDSVDHLPGNLKEILGNKLFEALDAKVSEGTKVSEGYVDDCRNTDNAWVETTVLNIHLDRTSQVMVDINNMVISGDSCLQWEEVSSRLRLSPNQRRSLQQVAELHNRTF